MIVGHRQELGLARGEPVVGRLALALGAVPVAVGVVGDVFVGAVDAAHDMAAERFGGIQESLAATGRARSGLPKPQMAKIGC